MLPKPVAKYYSQKLDSNAVDLPSSTTIYQLAMVLDVVLARKRRLEVAEFADALLKVLFYFYSDSSPQGNMNWLISSYDEIPGCKLTEAALKG